MPSKYVMTSNVRYNKKMRNDAKKVHHSERVSAISDCLVTNDKVTNLHSVVT